ncbi:neuropeptide FF receptor 2-like [Branchiostoma floridae]|uniref:Neuropeptide FF receptor 2-like n=1 Tax=Branchiostoma floridae TaxID=7739 RepID=A0A9J7KW38_BRAFL|nr:neuropeptide FF receptor 2-like [Branchiostoma floridae]
MSFGHELKVSLEEMKEIDSNGSIGDNQTMGSQNSGYSDSILKQSPAVIVVFVIGYLSVFVVCIIGNILVIYVVMKIPRMRTVTNYFILNLATSDLLVAIFCIPFTLVDNIIKGWPFGGFMCRLSPAAAIISVAASVFTLVAIALDRYYAVLYPTVSKFTVKSTIWTIRLIWFLAIIIGIPVMIVMGPLDGGDRFSGTQMCVEHWPTDDYRKAFTVSLLLVCFLLPLSIIGYLYVRIGYRIWFSMTPGQTKAAHDARASVTKRKTKVVKMLLVVVVLFTVTWLPLHIVMMLGDFGNLSRKQQHDLWIYVFPVAHWLSYIHSAMDPLIYGYYNRAVRTEFKTMRTRSMQSSIAMTSFSDGRTRMSTVTSRSVRRAAEHTSTPSELIRD